ncbi:hypothetical protein K3495_g580 [Podosphaera aphanis]|nr:hypothetical protein K3495_g580 [Podosphaera aphanis]
MELYGNSARTGAKGEVIDYDNPTALAAPILYAPEPSDSLETVNYKINYLADAVKQGHSLAIRTGFSKAANPGCDPTSIARSSMDCEEAQQYDSWRAGKIKLPHVDWKVSRRAIIGGAKSQNRFEKRAAAMREIYRESNIDAENAFWFTTEHTYALPLVKAIARIHGAQRNLLGGQFTLTGMELAEVQTARKIVATAMENLNRVSRSINAASKVIQARELVIKSKIATGQKRKEPTNDPVNFSEPPQKVTRYIDWNTKPMPPPEIHRADYYANTRFEYPAEYPPAPPRNLLSDMERGIQKALRE